MEKTYLLILKILLCLFIFLLSFAGINSLVQPVWMDWNNYDTVYGFYEEPENTIEVIFLGASNIVDSITPMELYEDFGICAYNLGTEQQPMMASYYWLEEAYRKHSLTLKTVVLDASTLRFSRDLAFYRKAIDGMELSSVKYNAVKDYSSGIGDSIGNLLPLYAYHDRWKSLTKTDFQKYDYSPNVCVRGYNFMSEQCVDSNYVLQIPLYFEDANAEETVLNTEGINYFEKIVDFCNVNELNLMLVRLGLWSSSSHNAIKSMAELYDLEFLDFSFEPLLSEIGFNLATDTWDAGHSNYYGAKKMTAYIGNYLKTNYQLQDVRKDDKYSYMRKQLDEYHASVSDVIKLKEMIDPREYLAMAISNADYTVFVMVKDDGSGSLTQEQRDGFAAMGLEKLSTLAFRDSYLAVWDHGRLVSEQIGREDASEQATISYEGKLDDGLEYALKSAGMNIGNKASCLIDGVEYAENKRGINVVIYDNETEKVIDTTYFDTYASSVRDEWNLSKALYDAEKSGKSYYELPENLQKLYLYNRRCGNARMSECLKQTLTEDGLFTFLKTYWKDDYIIYMSVMDEAAGALGVEARACLADYGLDELSQLEWKDSYLGIINSGRVVYEQKDHGDAPITTRYFNHILQSGGYDSGDCRSSILINGKEYSPNTRGINIVVYDTMTETVVDSVVFDTNADPVKVLDDAP